MRTLTASVSELTGQLAAVAAENAHPVDVLSHIPVEGVRPASTAAVGSDVDANGVLVDISTTPYPCGTASTAMVCWDPRARSTALAVRWFASDGRWPGASFLSRTGRRGARLLLSQPSSASTGQHDGVQVSAAASTDAQGHIHVGGGVIHVCGFGFGTMIQQNQHGLENA